MLFVCMLFAAVLLGVGATLLPPVEVVTDTIFTSLKILETAPPALRMIVILWPVWIAIAFVVKAFYMMRGA